MRSNFASTTRTLLAAALLVPGGARAEPYLALRTGLKCGQCHVNRSGGGGRNQYGSVYAQTMLPWKPGGPVSGTLGSVGTIGWDIRTTAYRTMRSAVPRFLVPRTAIELTEASVYLDGRVIPDVLTLHLDETVGPGRAAARELFGLVEGLPLAGYAKIGKFLLPYGLRLADDDEFIRGLTGFTYQAPDQGIEVGIEPGPISGFVALSNGSQGAAENDDGKELTGTLAVIGPRGRLGISGSHIQGSGAWRNVAGGFAGLAAGRFTGLAEADWIGERQTSGRRPTQFVAFLEGDVLLTRGLTAKVTYGYHDRNVDIPEDQRVRMRFGVEFFPNGFLRVAAFYIASRDIPQVAQYVDRAAVEMQFHF